MNIAFCYESVLPNRGGCETYITDISRRLISEGHEVHLYASQWDEKALPKGMHFHEIPKVRGPRFLRPWRFGAACLHALKKNTHDLSMGFNKTWGQDVLYPQGGLHAASFDHNLNKYSATWLRNAAYLCKKFDPSHLSYSRLERKQYLQVPQPTVIVNSLMVRRHFQDYYGIPADNIHVVRSAIDPNRFQDMDRLKLRTENRLQWGIEANDVVGLFAGINYRLKGLEPLLYGVQCLTKTPEYKGESKKFRLLVAGHPKYQRYEKLAQRLGIDKQVTFIGHCAPMRNAYFAADFLVHPTFYDPCSLVVLEALACSLPVITTRANGASELLHPLQEGYVIDDPHNYNHLAWSLFQLLDTDRRYQCSLAAHRAAQQWTFDHHYRALLDVFAKTAAKKMAA